MMHFRTLGELVQRAQEPCHVSTAAGYSPEEQLEWAGGRSLAEACSYLLRGASPDEVHQVSDLARAIHDLPKPTTSWAWKNDVAGSIPDVAAWLTGRPDAMRTVAERPGQHVLRRLIYCLAADGTVPAQEVQRAGAAAAALTQRLAETQPVELYFASVAHDEKSHRDLGWCIRVDDLGLDKIVALTATSTLRAVGLNLFALEAGNQDARSLRIAVGGKSFTEAGFDAALAQACGFPHATVLRYDSPVLHITRSSAMSESFEDAMKLETSSTPTAELPVFETEPATSDAAPADQMPAPATDDEGLDGSMTETDLDDARAQYTDEERDAIAASARQSQEQPASMLDESGDVSRREVGDACDAFIAEQEPKPAPEPAQDADADARARAAVANIFSQRMDQATVQAPSPSMSNVFGVAPVQDDVDVKEVAAQAAAKAASTIVARAPDVARASMEAAGKAGAATLEAAAAARRAAGEMARKSMHRIPWRKVGLIAGGVVVIGAAAFAAVHFMHAHQATPAASVPAVAPPPAPTPAPKPAVATAHPATPAPVLPQRESVPSAPAPKPAPAPVQAPAPAPAVSKPAAPARAPASQNSAAAEPRVRKPAHRASPKPSIDAKSKAQIQALETFFKQNGGGH